MAFELQGRNADDMSPIEPVKVPTEIRPVVTSLNGVLEVESARQHEREITAFAAHRTSYATCRPGTQAQIAIATAIPTARDTALSKSSSRRPYHATGSSAPSIAKLECLGN